MELRVSGHGVYRTDYHIVWIPKYRRHILNPGVRGYLMKLFPKVMEMVPGCEILEINIQPEHLHVVMIIPPKHAVSDVIEKLKGVTSSYLPKVMEMVPGCEILEINIQPEHLHVVMIIPPKHAVSDVIEKLKGVTSSYLRKKFHWLNKVYWKENIVWSGGYFVFGDSSCHRRDRLQSNAVSF